jgi:hypothetical protein
MTNTPNPVILDPAKLKTGNGDQARFSNPIFSFYGRNPLYISAAVPGSPALPESVDSDIKPIWIAFDVPPRRSHTGFVAPLPRRKSMPGERQSPRITIDH